jgi:hypothetical protein
MYPLSNNAKRIPRALLSTIMKNGNHPCPRCLVKKVDTIKMGTALDMRKRCTNARVDDHTRKTTVKHARRLVFEHGVPLASARLKTVLSKYSGIPTHVSPKT